MAERGFAGLGLAQVRQALEEDAARHDATTRLLGERAAQPATLRFVAEGRFVIAGLGVAELVFRELDAGVSLTASGRDGDWAEAGREVAAVRGPAGVLLAGERVALNFLQRLSGIATQTRRAVDAVAGTAARITHTRKTTPGLRALEQYAVRAGGGVDNRASLADAVMWKDNHWALLGSSNGALAEVLRRAPPGLEIVVEAENDAQLESALKAGAKHILADNQTPAGLATWVKRAGPGVTFQASGGITAANAREYALAGAGLISMGALTHSVISAPLRCDLSL